MHIDQHQRDIWAKELHQEFSAICYQYSLALKAPVIRIADLGRQLGCWEPAARQISISAELIATKSWQKVVNVLKHEMAHQICTEIFREEPGHRSEVFRRACLLLDLPEAYQRASLALGDEDLPQQGLSEGNRLIGEKIRKLLALSRSANEHEAAVAMAKARMLIDRHDISNWQTLDEEGVVYEGIVLKRRTVSGYHKRIAGILSQFFYVRLIQTSTYDQFQQVRLPMFEIFGRPAHVEIAVHCFHFLEERLFALWALFAKNLPKRSQRMRNSYMYGMLQGVREMLSQQEDPGMAEAAVHQGVGMAAASTDMVAARAVLAAKVMQLREIDRRVSQRYPRLTRRRASAATVYPEMFQQGVEAGKALTLHKVVSSTAKEKLFLPRD